MYFYNTVDGRLVSIMHIRDVSGNTTYNDSGAITGGSTDDQRLSRFSYSYDDNGQLISRARLFYDGSGSHLRTAWNEFTYDRLGRLVGESYLQNDATDQSKNLVRTFAYDLAGNRIAMQSSAGSMTYSHDDLHQLTGAGSSSYAYDLTGNLISSSGSVSRTLTWDVAGSLTQVSSGGNTVKYTYDDSGSGMLRSRQLNSGDTTYYFWEGYSLYLEKVGSNSARTYFNHPWELGSTVCRFDLGGNNQVDSTDNAWFYLHDEAGNVILVTDKDGQPAIEFEQDAWGNDLADNFNDSPYITQHQTGKLWDAEAGLYYNAARWYDPELGRFISVSPIAPFDEEEYAFCYNDPVNFGDINGKEPVTYILFELGSTGYDIYDTGSLLFDKNATWGDFGLSLAFTCAGTILPGPGNAYKGIGKRAVKSIKYSPINPGPLADDIANTFRAGTYTARTLDKPTTLYRVIGDKGNPTGSFWTRDKPQGPLQAVIDSALDQNWGNTATRVIEARIPAGTKIYEGFAAPQRGLVGGGNQVYIEAIDPSWIIP